MKIPFANFKAMHNPLKQRMVQAFEEVYDSNWFILGERVKKFEEDYAAFNHTKFALGISNGLDALHIALRTLHIGSGDEVIVPSNTYIATALAVSYTGATPVFVEPDLNTYNIKAAQIESAITGKTKAIMPVHLYGQCCEMNAIMDLAANRGIHVIEDNAQAQGATYLGKQSGSFGSLNATSFYPGKNLGALGDAGALTTNNEVFYQEAMKLRNYGSAKKYIHETIGFNMRMDECQAAFLSIKLEHLPSWNQQRQQIAAWYNQYLASIEEISLPVVAAEATHVYHLYVIRSKERDALQQYLRQQGIGTLIHYPIPPHLQQAYHTLKFTQGSFPIAEEIANTCLSLPLWPGMTEQEVQFVAAAIQSFFTRTK